MKHSIGINYSSMDPFRKVLQNGGLELAISNPLFLKFHFQRSQSFTLIPNKVNFLYNFKFGAMKNFSKTKHQTPINDRFYVDISHCFAHLGHFAYSNRKLDPKDLNKDVQKDNENAAADGELPEAQPQHNKNKKSRRKNIILGDDLGSEHFANMYAKLEFTDVPYSKYFNSSGIRPYIFGECVYYPPFNTSETNLWSKIQKYTRGGIGYGLVIPLTFIDENFTFHLYQNALIFNAL